MYKNTIHVKVKKSRGGHNKMSKGLETIKCLAHKMD